MGLTASATGSDLLEDTMMVHHSDYTIALCGNPNVRKKYSF